ncbi:serine/threonine protein kinase [Mycolicibacterium cosmeticum]|uniref:non-specific serine/threonine protein kinase n=1 Tax=Mycolicibacterium cosmeticum TaxID=258533 RepID=W9AWJ7_MYCCO|nr:serine/threonine-protein kinase [Mycolicibacterium cosmeticum]TLH80123.1 serine/threonine protein kinase [Mycolicibacterium cosmeticum]CDO07282.1 serine/threonine protein kinase [Mycolicibacterium cosmeticum]
MQGPELLGGRYELRGVLGRGGMAEVRAGWDVRLGRAVAIKMLYPQLSAQPDSRRRFAVEARAAAGLSHPHVVAVHDVGEHRTTPYIVMERLPGRTLADALDHGPLPVPHVRAVLDQVLSALSAAHGAGVLHRDIKPANILLTEDGSAKVADFGIAKSVDSADTVTGEVIGTVAYLSADRIAGRPATVADDLYAVAVVGYEALSGRRPFPQQNLAELARAVAERRYPPLATLRPDADPVLVAAIEQGLSGGFGSAAEMRAVLAGQAPMRPPTRVLAHPLPDPATTVLPRQRRRRPVLAAIGAFVVVVLVVLAFVVDAASRNVAPRPAGTATSEAPPPPVTTSAPPPTSLVPAPVDEQGPPKGRGNGNGKGNGNGHKPKHGEG